MQLPSLPHSVLVEVVWTSPFSEQSFSLSVRSWAVTLFSEYPLLFSVATPADKHLAIHPNGHTPTALTLIHTKVCMPTHAQLLPSPRELKSRQLFSGLGNKSSLRASYVSSLIETSTNNVAVAKEGFKSPGWRRRWLYRVKMIDQMLQGVHGNQTGRNKSRGPSAWSALSPALVCWQPYTDISRLSSSIKSFWSFSWHMDWPLLCTRTILAQLDAYIFPKTMRFKLLKAQTLVDSSFILVPGTLQAFNVLDGWVESTASLPWVKVATEFLWRGKEKSVIFKVDIGHEEVSMMMWGWPSTWENNSATNRAAAWSSCPSLGFLQWLIEKSTYKIISLCKTCKCN